MPLLLYTRFLLLAALATMAACCLWYEMKRRD